MSTESRVTLKGYFNSGDVPSEANYAALIESFVHKTEDFNTYLPPAYGTASALYPVTVGAAGTSWEYGTAVKIDSFANADHDHSNAAGGGAVSFGTANNHTHAGTASGGAVSFNGANQHTHAGTASGGVVARIAGSTSAVQNLRVVTLDIHANVIGTSIDVVVGNRFNAAAYAGTSTAIEVGSTGVVTFYGTNGYTLQISPGTETPVAVVSAYIDGAGLVDVSDYHVYNPNVTSTSVYTAFFSTPGGTTTLLDLRTLPLGPAGGLRCQLAFVTE